MNCLSSQKHEFALVLTADQLSACPLSLLAEKLGLTRTDVKKAMHKGALWFQAHSVGKKNKVQRLRRLSRSFKVGDTFFLYYDQQVLDQEPAIAELVSDEGEYSIWYKPCGMFSQGSKWGDHCTISRWAETYLKPSRPSFIVHRLDRATQGLIIIAHSKKAANAFCRLFENRGLEKTYQAIVHGLFAKETLTISGDIDEKQACSHVSLLARSEKKPLSLVSIAIETGRKHQIRRHLSESGFPVVGDRLYGLGSETDIDLQLTAFQLRFICPIKGTMHSYQLNTEHQLKLD